MLSDTENNDQLLFDNFTVLIMPLNFVPSTSLSISK